MKRRPLSPDGFPEYHRGMKMTNYHTHCSYCDGKGEARDYVLSAIRKGFTAIGFSSHAPLPFSTDWTLDMDDLPAYCREITGLKEEFAGSIRVLLGLEIDYLAGVMGPGTGIFAEMGLDYSIGSVHMLYDEKGKKYRALDGPQEDYDHLFTETFGGNARAFTEHYYGLVSAMCREHSPDIIGHIDVIMKNNTGRRFFSGREPWYLDAAYSALDAVRESGAVLEVNSGGLARGRTDFLYPEQPLLSRAFELGIPVMMNADAHAPEGVDAFYDLGFSAIRNAGYRSVRILLDGAWLDEPIE